jgi:hypothetical protein
MQYVSPGYYTQTNSASVSCSGSVHFKFTWVAPNGEKAPKQVITYKAASAGWSAPAVNGGGSCSTSLGGTVTSYNNGSSKGASMSEQTYTVLDSSSGVVEFDISLSASAYGSSSMTVPNSSGQVVANVSCDANVTSVRVLLGGFQHDPVPQGTTPWQCLTGDTLTANLDTETYPQIDPSWNWSATGPVFKDFFLETVTRPSTANPAQNITVAQDKGYRRSHEVADKNKGTFTFRFYDKGSSVVTCIAQILTPKGTLLTVTADSETITIIQPASTWVVTDGAVRILGASLTTGDFGLNPPVQGQDWVATATIPPPFTSRTADLAFSQNVRTNRFRWANLPAPDNLWGVPENGTWCLDNYFPYSYDIQGAPMSTSALVGGNLKVTVHTGDTPSVGLPGSLDYYEVQGKDDFEAWLIFRPNGGEWVSFKKYTWDWYGRCKRKPANDPVSPNAWYIAYPTWINRTPVIDTTDHPSWNQRLLSVVYRPIGQ